MRGARPGGKSDSWRLRNFAPRCRWPSRRLNFLRRWQHCGGMQKETGRARMAWLTILRLRMPWQFMPTCTARKAWSGTQIIGTSARGEHFAGQHWKRSGRRWLRGCRCGHRPARVRSHPFRDKTAERMGQPRYEFLRQCGEWRSQSSRRPAHDESLPPQGRAGTHRASGTGCGRSRIELPARRAPPRRHR